MGHGAIVGWSRHGATRMRTRPLRDPGSNQHTRLRPPPRPTPMLPKPHGRSARLVLWNGGESNLKALVWVRGSRGSGGETLHYHETPYCRRLRRTDRERSMRRLRWERPARYDMRPYGPHARPPRSLRLEAAKRFGYLPCKTCTGESQTRPATREIAKGGPVSPMVECV